MKRVQKWLRKWLGVEKLERDVIKYKRFKTIQSNDFYQFAHETRENLKEDVVDLTKQFYTQERNQIHNWYVQIGDWLRELDNKYKLDEAFNNKEKLKKRT